MSINPGLAKRLRSLVDRKFQGVPRRFANQAKISPGTFQRYIEGQSIPGGDALLRLSTASNVSTDWLLTGEEFDKEKATAGPRTWEFSNDDFQQLFLHLIKLQEVLGRAESIPERSPAKPTEKEMKKMIEKLQKMTETKA